MSKVKVKILPPAPQTVFFQEHQFDEDLNGTNPDFRGYTVPEPKAYTNVNGQGRKERLKRSERALDGHENKEAILKILKSE